MTISQPRSLLLGLTVVLAACGGEGLTLPPDGAAAHIEVRSGDGQSARVGERLPDSVVVRVTDTQNRPVAGVDVVFDFTAGGSTASPPAATDSDGITWSRLVLGTVPGPVTGKATVPVAAGVTPVEAAITATATTADANGIALVSGDAQTGAVGTELPAPLVVAVTDQFGNPIPGITVQWSVTGGGSVSSNSTITDANGQTSVTRALGPAAGPQTTQANSFGLAGTPVTFTHTAVAGTATGVVKVSGDNQSALAGTELTNPLVVRVLDDQQNPIANRAVTWIVTAGDGRVPAENTTTDAQGTASSRWTLGPSAGANSLNAVVSGVGTATFNATATAGTPSASNSVVSASPATINAGTGSSTITVTVRDAGNNPASGVSVTPASSGSENTISPASATTGTNGVVTFTFSSTVAEAKTITATAGGVGITDQATVTVQKVSSTVEITSDDDDPSTAGQNVTVEFTVSGSGGTPTGDVVITIDGGLPTETCTGTLSNGAGSCVLPMTLTGNRRVITATYAGDARFSGDTDTENHRVDPAPSENQPPVANDDPSASDAPYTTPGAGAPLMISAADGVLKNDSDPDGDSLSSRDASTPTLGTVALGSDGSFTYTPTGASGTDTFTYTVDDGHGGSDSGTVTITVQ